MESFIDLESNVVYTEAQIAKRLSSLERKVFSIRDETIMGRLSIGFLSGKRSPKAEEVQATDGFQDYMEELEALGVVARAENTLLIATLKYEIALVRLSKYPLLEGVEEVLYVEATYDEEGVELMPEVLYVASIAPLEEYVEVTDEEGDTITIRNPLVIKDEDERAGAQSIVDNASVVVKNLVLIREGLI